VSHDLVISRVCAWHDSCAPSSAIESKSSVCATQCIAACVVVHVAVCGAVRVAVCVAVTWLLRTILQSVMQYALQCVLQWHDSCAPCCSVWCRTRCSMCCSDMTPAHHLQWLNRNRPSSGESAFQLAVFWLCHINASCHKYEHATWHIYMTHVIFVRESASRLIYVRMSHVTHVNASCHMYTQVMSHAWNSQVFHQSFVRRTGVPVRSILTLPCDRVMSHTWTRHMHNVRGKWERSAREAVCEITERLFLLVPCPCACEGGGGGGPRGT